MAHDVLLLTALDVDTLLPWPRCVAAIEGAFRAHGAAGETEGGAASFGALGFHGDGGGFHVKAGTLALGRRYFAAKVNGNFPGNPARGMATIQGVVVLCDAGSGAPLAVLDSGAITRRRTAAATAVAARYLAREDARVLVIVGCGAQALAQVEAVASVRSVARVTAVDADARRAEALARSLARRGLSAAPGDASATREADIVITCTTSRAAILGRGDVRPGTFVAAVGADHPEKREIASDLMRAATVVVDALEQAAAFGDLHHAIAEGTLAPGDVHAELGQIVAGRRPGRADDLAITLFDSTGMALQDVAAAGAVFEAASRRGGTARFRFAGDPPRPLAFLTPVR